MDKNNQKNESLPLPYCTHVTVSNQCNSTTNGEERWTYKQ